MQLLQHCHEVRKVDLPKQQHGLAPCRPLAHPVSRSSTGSSSGSNVRRQQLQATSSVAESPTEVTNQVNPLSTQPNSTSQRPGGRLRTAPAAGQTVLTMDTIAKATKQNKEVCIELLMPAPLLA
jgi:hypothetical protein